MPDDLHDDKIINHGEDHERIAITLLELWETVDDLKLKVYTGLDDKTLETVKVQHLSDARLRFEELTILFLDPEITQIKGVLNRLGSVSKPRLAAHYKDFDRFFESLLKFKEAKGILNTATAFAAMVEIIEDWLAKNAEKPAELSPSSPLAQEPEHIGDERAK